MEKMLTLNGAKNLHIGYFDNDKGIEISMVTSDYEYSTWISPNQVNELITHLADQLKSINEPVDILTLTGK